MHYRMISRSISFLGGNVLNSWTERSYVSMSLFSFRMSPLSAVLAEDHLSSSMFVGYNRCHYKEDCSSWGFIQRQLDTATSGMPGRSACCERSCSTKIGKGVPAWATPFHPALWVGNLSWIWWICLKIEKNLQICQRNFLEGQQPCFVTGSPATL